MVYHSSERRPRRLPLVIAAVVGILAVVATYLILRPDDPEADRASTTANPDCVSLEVLASTEKGDLLSRIADDYNHAGRTFDGACAAVSVHKLTSGAAADALGRGWDAKRDGSPTPQVWTPTSSLWLGIVAERGTAADRSVLATEKPRSIAQSPLVIAMPKPMAQAMGWPRAEISWADVLGLASDPRGWGRRGHPEWGRFSLGKDNPRRSTSGMAATVATYYAATGRSSDLAAKDLTRPEVTTFVRGVEASVVHYADDAVRFLANLAEADRQGRALSYVSAIAMQEELVHLYNSGDPTAVGKDGRKPSVPLVALHPRDGTLMLDHPYVVLPSANADQKAAAEDFFTYLREPAQQKRLSDLGFRDYQGKLSDEVATSIGATGRSLPPLIEAPAPAVLEGILDGWDNLRKKAKVLLVLDVSGSMNDPAGGGESKMEAARRAAVRGLDRLHPDDEVALWVFSTEDAMSPAGGGGRPYRQVVPLTRIGTGKERITRAIEGLSAEGGTALYTSVRAAQRHMLTQIAPDRINAVVVLTDGRNEYPSDNDLDALLRDLDARTLERSVRVFSIAFGERSDLDTLARIGEASRGSAYDARDPATIDDVFVSVLSNF